MTRSEVISAYEAANKAFDATFAVLEAAKSEYRAKKISDEAYCAVFAAHEVSRKEFDVAFAAMGNLPEEKPVAEASPQLLLI